MQLKWIDDLLVLEKTRSFSRAAELRHITQSALSRRIRSLEDWAGAVLVDRNTFPMDLTPAGKTFCTSGREALTLLMEARATLRQESRMPGKAIQIAAGHTLSLTFLPGWLRACQKRYGQFNARVVAANVLEAVVALSEGNCDLMLGYNHTRVPVSLDPDKFRSLTVGHDVLMPLCAPNARGAPLFSLGSSGAKPIPYLAYTASTTLGRIVEVILEDAPPRRALARCYEADMAILLMKMASEGHGVAWLPRTTAADALAAGTLVPAGDATWCSAFDICAYRAAHASNPTLLALWEVLERVPAHGEGGGREPGC
ncbi:LysR substrate-binding domain-containing protein [Cupriavidus basilensis]|uniref:LysR substrate-binding domain-containing protein n=1 Tax=Cupriavidus basilensis TaxID=68895 RepID=UPI0020A69F34|nr:LysR substrate-binding domain-containing protein [Cupriavidus basilensis]MCP3023436.1 LysR substrate-binding domain-containing protein [Cupriavidus basilensis]